MADFDKKEKALRIISKQLLALEDVMRGIRESHDTTLGFEQLRRWKSMTIGLLAEAVSEAEANELRNKKPGAFVLGQPLRNFIREAKLYEAFLLSLNEALQINAEMVLPQNTKLPVTTAPSHPISDLFISYSSRDIEFVTRLAKDLTSRGVRVWWDKWAMKVGDSLHRKIQDGISNSAWLCVVLSPFSVSSPWVEKELNSALRWRTFLL